MTNINFKNHTGIYIFLILCFILFSNIEANALDFSKLIIQCKMIRHKDIPPSIGCIFKFEDLSYLESAKIIAELAEKKEIIIFSLFNENYDKYFINHTKLTEPLEINDSLWHKYTQHNTKAQEYEFTFEICDYYKNQCPKYFFIYFKKYDLLAQWELNYAPDKVIPIKKIPDFDAYLANDQNRSVLEKMIKGFEMLAK